MPSCLICGKTEGKLIRGLCLSHYHKCRRNKALDRFPKLLIDQKRERMAEVRKMRRCEDPAHIQSVTDQSLRLYNGGTSIEAISKIVHTSCDRISRILRGSGVKVNRINKIPHRVYVDDDISEAYMMRIQGKTFQEIADWLGCSTSTASRLYQEECIRRRNEGI